MSPKDCAYIVERLAIRFMALVADHSRQLAEHRAAFGARTEADAKIIAGLRSEIVTARMAVLERDSLISERAKLQAMVNEQSASAKYAGETLGWTANESAIQAVERVVKERNGLLTQVQDMRAEITRLTGHNADAALHDLLRREYDKAQTLCETDDQTPAECIGSLNARIDRLQDDARSDARVRENLHRINVELGAEVAFLKIRDREYEKALDLCDKEEQTPAECIAALQERLRSSIARGDFAQMEVAALKSQTPQHPVKVGEWVRRSKLPGDQSPVGIVKQVTSIRCDGDSYGFADGEFWSVDNCEPCTHQHPAQDGQWVRRTIASGTEPVGTMIQVQRSRTLHSEYVTRKKRVVPWAHCEPCDPPATHDTEQGKATAESAVRTDPVAEEIKVGDMAKVVGASGDLTAQSDIGKIGEVLQLDSMDGTVLLSGGAGWVDHRDVRKVTT